MRTGASSASPVSWERSFSPRVRANSISNGGWVGMQFYPRSKWPSATGIAPDGVDGVEADTAAFAEWELHVARVLPELAVHDLTQRLADTEERLEAVVHAGRSAGVTWSRMRSVSSRATGGFVRLHG